MKNFFGSQPLSPEELQRRMASQQRSQTARARHMSTPNPQLQGPGHAGEMPTFTDAQMLNMESLDDIIFDNQQEIQRRRNSFTQTYTVPASSAETGDRLPYAEFGAPGGDALPGYQFGQMDLSPTNDVSGGFSAMGNAMAVPGNTTGFAQPNMMALADPNDFSNLTTDMMGNVISFSNLNMGALPPGPTAMEMFGSPHLDDPLSAGHLDTTNAEYNLDMDPESDPLGGTHAGGLPRLSLDTDQDMMAVSQPFGAALQPVSAEPQAQQLHQRQQEGRQQGAPATSRDALSASSFPPALSAAPVSAPAALPQTSAAPPLIASPSAAEHPLSAPVSTPRSELAKEKSLYSKSGFDMMRALWYVATRKNAEVQLGAVDMSCAFVVCDVTLNDCPIIYVSDNFQNLTGYSRHEIVGQNCRFLQAPDGKVEAGSRREFVENSAVLNLKRKIAEGKEVQQSLINYRKGGKPFLNLLTMIPIPWDTEDVRYFVGFQIDLVECPDAIAGQETGGIEVNYKHSDIGQYIWTPPSSSQWEREGGQTLGVDDISALLQQFNPKGLVSDWHKQSWDKMLLENADDVVHVLSLKGLFLYLSPSCKKVLEYEASELVGGSLASICHPSDIVPVTRELKETTAGGPVNIVFRIRRKHSGYTWFESHGSLFVEQGKGRKSIILVGRKRPVFALHRRELEAHGGIGDSELWTKLSTSGMFLFVSSNVRSLLDLQPESLEGTSIQDLMRKESRAEFGRSVERARRGRIVTCKHEVHNRRGQVLQAQTVLYPGDAAEGQKPSFLLAQTKLLKASTRGGGPPQQPHAGVRSGSVSVSGGGGIHGDDAQNTGSSLAQSQSGSAAATPAPGALALAAAGGPLALGSQDAALAADDNIFDELKTTRCTSWQYELRQMEKVNRLLAEELGQLLSNKKKRKRRKGVGNVVRDCANCHTRNTPEWRRGPSGQRDLCNSCGLRWAKQTGRVSPRNSSRGGGNGDTQSKKSNSPIHMSPLQREMPPSDTAVVAAAAASGAAGAQPLPHAGNDLPANAASAAAVATANMVAMGMGLAGGSSASSGGAGGGAGGSSSAGGGSGSSTPLTKGGHSIPPPSQPGLDPGSGVMTSIREERE